MKPRTITWTLIVFSVLSHSVFAQAPTSADLNELRAQMDALKADYDKRIQTLEAQLQALQNQTQAPPKQEPAGAAPTTVTPTTGQQTVPVPPGAEGGGGPSGQLPVYGAATAASKVFNPA